MARLQYPDLNLIAVDSDLYEGQETGNLAAQSKATDLAYVVYTSGTSGKPKGVMVEHSSICNFVAHYKSKYKIDESDRLSQLATVAFDAFGCELWPALCSGAQLHILLKETALDTGKLVEWIKTQQITICDFPTRLGEIFFEEQMPEDLSLKYVKVGGEAFEKVPAKALDFAIINTYGPTEATIEATNYDAYKDGETCLPGAGSVPIGKGLQNYKLYVLDTNLNPTPIGIPGELHIGGGGLARGYLNQSELTAEKFIENPFASEEDKAKGYTRLYKTGDLVRWLPDGNIEYIGRNDFQVKIRGYRIELSGIEHVLAGHESIAQASVMARSDGDKEAGKQLVAYCVINDAGGTTASEAEREAFVQDWEVLYDTDYKENADEVDTFDISGWDSSFTGTAIPAEEMQEWVDETVKTIVSFSPKHILEIGCGTGLLLYPLVSHCESYTGIDFSKEVINKLQRSFPTLSIHNAHVETAYANQLDAVDLGTHQNPVDTVIINSVVQYFPNQAYLDEVIEQSLGKLRSGKVILGDIRDYRLLDAFQLAVQVHQSEKNGTLDWAEMKKQAEHDAKLERELLVAPEYFIHLKKKHPGIRHVELLPKRGHARHEMNRFRYDVVLHVESDDEAFKSKRVNLDWIAYEEATDIRELLSKKESLVAVKNYPNKRVWADASINALLSTAQAIKDDELDDIKKKSEGVLELEELHELAAGHGYRLYTHLSIGDSLSEACYDLVFYDETVISDPYFHIDSGEVRGGAFSNNPLKASLEKVYDFGVIRNYLEDKLPDYMIPNAFVKMEHLPLTTNGKLDRKALPDPGFTSAATYVAPVTKLEKELCVIWQDVLKLEKVGVTDDFFKVGGHSILAIKLMYKMNEYLAEKDMHFNITDLFKHKSIQSLLAAIPAENRADNLIKNLSPGNSNEKQVFFVHPGYGGCEVYVDLANELKNDYNSYGIDNFNILSEEQIADLNLLAKKYVEALADFKTTDEINLCGWSLGGQIALEMGYLLEQEGFENITICLLDTLILDDYLIDHANQQDETELNRKIKEQLLSEGYEEAYVNKIISASKAERAMAKQGISGLLESSTVYLFKALQENGQMNEEERKIHEYIQALKDANVGRYVKNLEVIPVACNHWNILEIIRKQGDLNRIFNRQVATQNFA